MPYILGGAFVLLAVYSIIQQALNPPKPIALEDLPPDIRAEMDLFPAFLFQSGTFNPYTKKYRLNGNYSHHSYRFEVEMGPKGQIKEVELEPRKRSSAFTGHPQPGNELPALVYETIAPSLVGEIDTFSIQSVYQGETGGAEGLSVRARSERWSWEFLVTLSGDLIEFEKERRRL